MSEQTSIQEEARQLWVEVYLQSDPLNPARATESADEALKVFRSRFGTGVSDGGKTEFYCRVDNDGNLMGVGLDDLELEDRLSRCKGKKLLVTIKEVG